MRVFLLQLPPVLSSAYFKYLDMVSITFVYVIVYVLMTASKEEKQTTG